MISWENLVTGPNTTKRFARLEDFGDAVGASFHVKHSHRDGIFGVLIRTTEICESWQKGPQL